MTASFLKSPGLFSVFWPSSIMLSFEWSLLVHHYYYYYTPLEFFTSVLTDGFTLEFE